MEQISIKSINPGIKPAFGFIVDPRFQKANRLFVLLINDKAVRTEHRGYLKDWMSRFMTRTLFYQPLENDTKTYGNIGKIVLGQGDDSAAVLI